ncbi:hypothetical protein Tco_1186973 [Tanacetum coccineum]
MTTLADKSLLSGGDNKPPMLEKHLYDSWKSRMELYMLNRPHGRMILASVEKGPLVWPSITVDGVTRLKEYIELTPAEAIQADCDIKAINIILQGLPTEIYALVSQHRVAKDLWEKIKLLMQGTSLTKQEREFNTKFLNTLPDEWSKFVTDVKLVKDLHTTNVDQLHAYLQQHERHANEVRLMHEHGLRSSCISCISQLPPKCTMPKRKRDEKWFNDKVLLVQAQASGQVLTEEEITFLADPRLPDTQTSQTVITHNATYQADALDAYDSDCDELNSAKIALMTNHSRNGSDALTEVHNPDNLACDLINQSEQIMTSSKQSNDVNQTETEITMIGNIIPYSQY